MIPFLLAASVGVGALNRIASKTCSNVVAAKSNRMRYLLYLSTVAAVACLVFAILNGFKISATPKTLLYALIYSGVCILSCVCHLEAFKYSNISGVVVLSSFGSITATSAVGFILFNEAFELTTLLKIGIMLAASILTFIGSSSKGKSQDQSGKRSSAVRLVIIVLLLMIAGVLNTVLLKLFSAAEGVTDVNSMFFFTNVSQGVCALILYGFFALKGRSDPIVKENLSDSLKIFSVIPLVAIAVNTAMSNIGTAISAKLITLMEISVYTPVSSALGILAGFIASFIYREKHGITFYLTAALAIVAVII